MAVHSRQELAEYCLQRLGAPLLNIEIADEQIENCISEAIDYYHEYHSDGIERDVYKIQITQADIDRQYFELPEGIVSILKVVPYTGMFTQDYLFDGQYQFWLSEIKFLNNYQTSHFYTTMDYLNHVDFILNRQKQFRFNRRMNKLFIDTDWKKNLQKDMYLVLEVYRELDPEQYPSVYNDRWLKHYTTAVMKYQWGTNLSKYEGMELPGGIRVNGSQIKEEAKQDILELQQELYDIGAPLAFQMG